MIASRSLEPLPTVLTTRRRRSTSPRSRPESSLTRRPVAYSSSRMARSRSWISGGLGLPIPSAASGALSRRSTSWRSTTLGSSRSVLGMSDRDCRLPRFHSGSGGTTPRAVRYRKNERSATRWRVTLARSWPVLVRARPSRMRLPDISHEMYRLRNARSTRSSDSTSCCSSSSMSGFRSSR